MNGMNADNTKNLNKAAANVVVPVEEQDENEIIALRRERLKELKAAGKDPFCEVNYDVDAYSRDIVADLDKYEGKYVSVAGRIMSKRVMGKAAFAHIRDSKGDIQLYFRIDELGAENYDEFKKYHSSILDAIQKSGAAMSHHHGIGKMFGPWLEGYLGRNEFGVFKALKNYFDPEYLMNPGGTIGLDVKEEDKKFLRDDIK